MMDLLSAAQSLLKSLDHRVVVVLLLLAVMALFSLRAQAEQGGGGMRGYPLHLNQTGSGGIPYHQPVPSCST